MRQAASQSFPDHSGVVIPPPLFYVVFFLAGITLQRYAPLPRLPIAIGLALAAVLLVVWVILTAWSFNRFWTSKTSMIPVKPTTALVMEGPYRFSRNPMYLGLLLLYAAIACWLGNVWPLLLVPVVVWVMNVLVIRREEAYLERKFGDPYRQYKAHVHRWV